MPTDTKTAHTPTPWAQGITCATDGSRYITADCGTKYHRRKIVAEAEEGPGAQDNAAFIVRACNAHDALVEALEGLLTIPPSEPQDGPMSNWPEKARAALTLARGEA